MKNQILKAIELYVNEPTGFIRAIPDPEILAGFIEEELNKKI